MIKRSGSWIIPVVALLLTTVGCSGNQKANPISIPILTPSATSTAQNQSVDWKKIISHKAEVAGVKNPLIPSDQITEDPTEQISDVNTDGHAILIQVGGTVIRESDHEIPEPEVKADMKGKKTTQIIKLKNDTPAKWVNITINGAEDCELFFQYDETYIEMGIPGASAKGLTINKQVIQSLAENLVSLK